jgi:glycosyltransferase involved in cell wall biosynthesis
MINPKPHILFVAHIDSAFISHRLPIAIEAIKRGYKVSLVAGSTGLGKIVENYGITYFPWDLSRSGTNIIQEFKSFLCLFKYYKQIKPDIIHHIAIKPIVYGNIVAKLLGIVKVVNAVVGMGYIFTDNRVTFVRIILSFCFKLIFKGKNKILILQNRDDANDFIKKNWIKEKYLRLIIGSGVDIKKFKYSLEPSIEPLRIVLPARLVKDKGVLEFVEVAKILGNNNKLRFVLVGNADEENNSFISKDQIAYWQSNKTIDWLGHCENMFEVYKNANIVVLPSYREGLPKSLIEACAVGRAIVTTDVPGCREIVKHNVNGLIVPSKNVLKLLESIQFLIDRPKERQRMGKNGAKLVEKEYTIEQIVNLHFDIYNEL